MKPDPSGPTDAPRSSHDGAVRGVDLFRTVYEELRALARERIRHERPGHTLQATALVHEVYARVVHGERIAFNDRRHFFATAAEAMRRILIEHARTRGAQKREGGRARVPLLDVANAVDLSIAADLDDVTELDAAIETLAAHDPRSAEVVRLRFFAGLSGDEVAKVLGVSRETVKRDWEYARAWLARALGGS